MLNHNVSFRVDSAFNARDVSVRLDKIILRKQFRIRGKEVRAVVETPPTRRRACATFYRLVDQFKVHRNEGRDFEICARSLQILHLHSWEYVAKVSAQENVIIWHTSNLERMGLDVDNDDKLVEHMGGEQENGAATPTPQEPGPAGRAAPAEPPQASGRGQACRKKGKGGQGCGVPAAAEKRAADIDLEGEMRDERAADDADQDMQDMQPPGIQVPADE